MSRYPGPDTIHRYLLDNGLTLLVYENFAAATVVVDAMIRTGALAESPAQAGLASFTASMLMRGTQQRDFADIYEALESVGAGLSFSSNRHITDFSGGGLVEDPDFLLKLAAESLRYPTFPDEHIEQVRGETLTGLHIRANDTRQMAALKFQETVYAGHPYGVSVEGYPETISAINRDDLVQFHAENYGPTGMTIVIVGAVKAEEALAKVVATLGDWQNPAQKTLPALPEVARPRTFNHLHVPMKDKTQSDIILGWPGPSRVADDYLAASLANTVLGVFGMMGRLGQRVREEQGLAYYASSAMRGGLGPSPWYVSTGVAPDKVEQALTSIRHEVRLMRDELVPDEELADCKAYRTGSLPVSLETNSGLADVIGNIALHDLGWDYLSRFPDLMNNISAEDVRAAAQKYLDPDNVVVTVAGP
ncbi:MAG: insulinase family protein [Chloroflexi bacterium]|nr:insulinase family protein [Chloroflexota bacterium]